MTVSDKRKVFFTFLFPTFFCFLCFLIKLIEVVFEVDLATFGVYPRKMSGIIGVFMSPLIHGDWGHLFSNLVPLFILSLGLFYYYRPVAYKTFITIYLATGFWVWVSARSSFHIGASGIVYGLAAFHFVSGIIRGHKMLMAWSLFVVFLYGSLIWGILPIDPVVSWESHLLGGVAGIFSAIAYRKIGLQKEVYHWPEEPDEPEDVEVIEDIEPFSTDEKQNQPPTIIYEYVESPKKEEPKKD